MHISIIGTAGSGKSTLFRALSGIANDDPAHISTLATIDVPDERLENLTRIFIPKKTVYARIELSDTVPIGKDDLRNETIQSKTLQQMRLSDAFLLVLPALQAWNRCGPLLRFHTDIQRVHPRRHGPDRNTAGKDQQADGEER